VEDPDERRDEVKFLRPERGGNLVGSRLPNVELSGTYHFEPW
jgi:hypothetical protein